MLETGLADFYLTGFTVVRKCFKNFNKELSLEGQTKIFQTKTFGKNC